MHFRKNEQWKRKLRALGEFIAEESFSLKSELGIHICLGGKKRKDQPHSQSFKGMCGNGYGRGGGGNPTWALSDPDVQGNSPQDACERG